MDILQRLKIPPFCWALAGTCLALAPFGDTARMWLRYDRSGIEAGAWWRLLSAHLVHLGWPHTLMNIAALLLTGAIAGQSLRPFEWWIVTLSCACGISVGLYVFDPNVAWYVGLSGVLHGLLSAAAVALWLERDVLGAWLGAGVIVKLAYEQRFGPLPATQALTGDSVIIDAHLYGALCGIAAFVLCRVIHLRRLASV
jgi:rhomboid family GlyGly-CTERM serine protease